jgi:hypothetical protein
MEFRESLEQRLNRKGWLPLAEVVRIGIEMAAALQALHNLGRIHGNLSLETVCLEGKSRRVKFLDAGPADGPATPEQARGKALDQRSDLFGLGCVLYCLTTGRVPFQGSASLTSAEPPEPASLNRRVPPDLWALIMRLLAKRRRDRPQAASDVVYALRIIASALPADETAPLRQAEGEGWYFACHKHKIGPFSWAELRLLSACGLLREDDRLRRKGERGWRAASMVGKLLPGEERHGPYRVALGSWVYGPYASTQISVWLAMGKLHVNTPACAEGASQWRPLAETAEFRGLAPGTPVEALLRQLTALQQKFHYHPLILEHLARLVDKLESLHETKVPW